MAESSAGAVSIRPTRGQCKRVSGIIGKREAAGCAEACRAGIGELLFRSHEKSRYLFRESRFGDWLTCANQILVTA